MVRLACLLLLVGCGSRQAVPATSYEDKGAAVTCPAGNWVPGSQEPPEYVACAADSDCVKMEMPGCCSTTYVAIRADRICGSDLGSSCDMVCDKPRVSPDGGEYLRAACVASKCTLVE